MDGKATYYQRNRKIILNRPKGYYEYNKDRIRDQARNKYWELSEEEKNKNREYERNRHYNISEENKQRLKEYQKNIVKQNISTRLKDQPVLIK